MNGVAFASIVVEDIFIRRVCRIEKEMTRKNIIIVGGQLFNKGAQAMTFTVVDQMKRKFPDKNIYLLSTVDFKRDEEEKIKYNFEILPWDFNTKLLFLGLKGKFFSRKSKYGYLYNVIHDVIREADFFIDISGYALSSSWGVPDYLYGPRYLLNLKKYSPSSISYLLNIATAIRYSIPYYILPQSLGPFNYPLKVRFFLYPLLNLYLKYPEKIFVREKEGVNSVSRFAKNVEKSYDIVLLNKNYNIDNIYREKIPLKQINVESNSVGIIPNLRVIERSVHNDIYSIYIQIINTLINENKNIYLVRHSYEDLEICELIKSFFAENEKVTLIPDDLNAIELETIIKQFDFVIASRYHSIVHSYKNGVPALVIGWATKYFELMESFEQLDYFFDVRKKIDVEKIINKLNKMIYDYKNERKKIINEIEHIQNQENIWLGAIGARVRSII